MAVEHGTYGGDEALERLLAEAGSAYGSSEVRDLLAGVLAAPTASLFFLCCGRRHGDGQHAGHGKPDHGMTEYLGSPLHPQPRLTRPHAFFLLESDPIADGNQHRPCDRLALRRDRISKRYAERKRLSASSQAHRRWPLVSW